MRLLTVVGILIGPLLGPGSVRAESGGEPIAIETYLPVDLPPTAEMTPVIQERRLSGSPEGSGRNRAGKLAAAFDPRAQPPDSIVPMVAAATVNNSYVGLDQLSDPSNLNPPDTTLAKSGFRVLEAVNSSLRLFLTAGSVLQTKSLLSFFSASSSDGTMFDPRVVFGRLGPNLRFYVVAAQVNTQSRISNLHLAVSRTPNPNDLEPANWCRYVIPGRRDQGTAFDSFADYPMLGLGTDTLVLSDNQATFSPLDFGFAIVRVFNRLTLSDNAMSCPAAQATLFQPEPTAANNLNVYSLQPVEHYTSPSSGTGFVNPVYLVSTSAPPTATYRIWAVRNVASGSPTLTAVNTTGSYTFDAPADAPQLGTPVLLDTNNWRIRQAAGLGDSIWAAHTTVCNISAPPNESCVRVVRLNVTPGTGATNHGVTLAAQTTFGGGDNIYYWMPGIAVNNSLQTAIAFQHSSASTYLSASWSIKNNAAASYPAAQPLTTGTCSLVQGGSVSRTGDYVGAQTNPNDLVSFWLAGERVTTLGSSCLWETRILQVTP